MESLSSRPSTTAAVRVSNNYTSRVSSLAPWQAWRASEFVIRRDAPSSSQWNPSKGSSYPTTSISIRPPSLITQCRATPGLAGKGSRSAALQYCFNFIAILHPSNLFRSYYFEFISILLPELTQISVSERAHIFSLAVDKSMIDYLKKNRTCNFVDSKADRVVDFSILHDEIRIYNPRYISIYRYMFRGNNQRAERGFAMEWLWSFY